MTKRPGGDGFQRKGDRKDKKYNGVKRVNGIGG